MRGAPGTGGLFHRAKTMDCSSSSFSSLDYSDAAVLIKDKARRRRSLWRCPHILRTKANFIEAILRGIPAFELLILNVLITLFSNLVSSMAARAGLGSELGEHVCVPQHLGDIKRAPMTHIKPLGTSLR